MARRLAAEFHFSVADIEAMPLARMIWWLSD
ncbi:hypothetical protein M003_14375 [Pseudomonas aeruginosa IGB83]|jgi:hypothetical protein|nr:hypothetical protein M003_14375 [Pseudomonas aeruginosa IGB83]